LPLARARYRAWSRRTPPGRARRLVTETSPVVCRMRAVVSSNSAKRRTTIAIAAVSEIDAISVQKKSRLPSEASVRRILRLPRRLFSRREQGYPQLEEVIR
jgi:hypothetical protein